MTEISYKSYCWFGAVLNPRLIRRSYKKGGVYYDRYYYTGCGVLYYSIGKNN